MEEIKTTRESAVLIVSILIISACSIVYELLISTISSYLLGSSILHFSLTIGIFMFFLGVGAYLSRFIEHNLVHRFIQIELALGLLGGLSALLLYFAFAYTEHFYLTCLGVTAGISTAVGIEVPLVTRILNTRQVLKEALANILAFDYLGALVASLLFPVVFLPYLGPIKTACVMGILNIAVGLVNIWEFRDVLREKVRLYVSVSLAIVLLLVVSFGYSEKISSFMERAIYQDEVIYSAQTPFQRLVLTRFKDDLRLFINGDLQFSSLDEYRYHESLVHMPFSFVPRPEKVLIIGGGDGLVAREVLKYPEVEEITLVDIDKGMIELFQANPILRSLNEGALSNTKLKIVTQDAYRFIEKSSELFSVVIIDLPDPNDVGLGKLYSVEFYELLKKRLAKDGMVVTQAGSPYFSRKAFWCIAHTVRQVFGETVPYNVYVPSFGLWGFVAAGMEPINLARAQVREDLRYFSLPILQRAIFFEPDTDEIPTEVNRMENQKLVQYYEESMREWR